MAKHFKTQPVAKAIKVIAWRQACKEVQSHTMACWWPSRVTGKGAPDWNGIVGELDALVEGAKARLGYNTAMQGDVLRLAELRQWASAQRDIR